MKTMKLMTLGLAGMMSFQQVALAQSSNRLEGIGDSQALMARHEMRNLKRAMVTLDKALEQTELQIQDRKSSGTITNGLSIAAAGISVVAAAYSTKMLFKRSEGADLESSLAVVASLIAGASSFMTGSATSLLKQTVEVEQLTEELQDADFTLEGQISLETDKERIAILQAVRSSFKTAAGNLKDFQSNQSQEDKRLYYMNMAQAAAAFTTFITLATGGGGFGLMNVAMGSTGIARIVVGLQGNNADVVLKEISKTRAQLKSALSEL